MHAQEGHEILDNIKKFQSVRVKQKLPFKYPATSLPQYRLEELLDCVSRMYLILVDVYATFLFHVQPLLGQLYMRGTRPFSSDDGNVKALDDRAIVAILIAKRQAENRWFAIETRETVRASKARHHDHLKHFQEFCGF